MVAAAFSFSSPHSAQAGIVVASPAHATHTTAAIRIVLLLIRSSRIQVELDLLRALLLDGQSVHDFWLALPAQHCLHGRRLEQALRLGLEDASVAHAAVRVHEHFELHPARDAIARGVSWVLRRN